MAYLAEHVVQGLRVYTSRREQSQQVEAQHEPDGYVLGVGLVARGGLDVCCVGRSSRARADRGERAGREERGAGIDALAESAGDVRVRDGGVGVLQGREYR